MAVSRIEEKILGRLARQAAHSNVALSSSIYQVLGLSILLSRTIAETRQVRKQSPRDAKTSNAIQHVLWLAREGLAITEVSILPYCQNGEQGPECRVMAARLRAGFYHIFCLYHNHPRLDQVAAMSNDSTISLTSALSPRSHNEQRPSPSTPSKDNQENGAKSRRSGSSASRPTWRP